LFRKRAVSGPFDFRAALAMASNAGYATASAPAAPNSTVVLCLETSESLVEPLCSTAELQQELVPYVLSHSLNNSKFLKLTKEERKARVKALTQKMLSGEHGVGAEGEEALDEASELGPVRFWAHVRAKYGTRRDQLLETLKHLEAGLRGRKVVVLRFEGETGEPSASLVVRASGACHADATANAATASNARKEFAASSFSAQALGAWLEGIPGGSGRAPPLWSRLADECQGTEDDKLVFFLFTEMRSTDTAPEALAVAGNMLHNGCKRVPYLSGLSFGAPSSERLQALEELCAWSGGLSFNIDEPTMMSSAADCLSAHLFSSAQDSASSAFDERRAFYHMKQQLGTCFLVLPSIEARSAQMASTLVSNPASALSPVTLSPAKARPASLLELLSKSTSSSSIDGAVPSECMLAVLTETSLCLPRRWSRGLRCWRERRALRDVVFSEPGGLGLELDEPELEKSEPLLQLWRLRTTHPPASALKMQENSVLVAVNKVRVTSETQRSEVSRRAALRPVSFTFKVPPGTKGVDDTWTSGGSMLKAVVSEIVVAELREGFPAILKGKPPLSTALERVGVAQKALAKTSARQHQATRLLQDVSSWGAATGSSAPAWVEKADVEMRTGNADDALSAAPALFYRILLLSGDATTLARVAQVCPSWRWLVQRGARRSSGSAQASPATAQYRLWRWTLRWGSGPRPAERFAFWAWMLSPSAAEAACALSENAATDNNGCAASAVLVAALSSNASELLRLTAGLGGSVPGVEIAVSSASRMVDAVNSVAEVGSSGGSTSSAAPALPPADILEPLLREPYFLQRLWTLSHASLPWLVRQGRVMQVMLAAHCPNLFKHLVTEGVAPELFYCCWLQGLFHDSLGQAADVVWLWDNFIIEGSYKIFIRAAIAIFALLEPKLMRVDVDGMMKILFDFDAWGFEPGAVRTKALDIKVTRSMLKNVERVDGTCR